MKDKNGVEIMTGDVVRVSGGYFKNSNGIFFVEHSKGDPDWIGKDHCLKRVSKTGKLSTARYSTMFWPISVFTNDAAKSREAKEWNEKNAEIEVVTDVPANHIRAYFGKKFEEAMERAKMYERRFGPEYADASRSKEIAEFYREVETGLLFDADEY